MKFSFESEELINEVNQDILEFGEEEIVWVWKRILPEYDNAEVIVNYDFIVPENPVKLSDLEPNEKLLQLTLGELLQELINQDGIL